MRQDRHLCDENTIVAVDKRAARFITRMLLSGSIAVAALPVGVWFAVGSGPVPAFIAVLVTMLILTVPAIVRLPSKHPLVLSAQGATIQVVGASVFLHWDGIERIHAAPHRKQGTATSLAFHLRPGAVARGLCQYSGWLGEWLIRENTAIVRFLPAASHAEILALAQDLHRRRLAETSRIESPLSLITAYDTSKHAKE